MVILNANLGVDFEFGCNKVVQRINVISIVTGCWKGVVVSVKIGWVAGGFNRVLFAPV